MERTCWRGMQMDHPADWELTLACGAEEPGRCTFSDRLYQRFDVRWKPVKYVPNLELMLDKHRAERDENVKIMKLSGAPPEWRGLIRKSPEAAVVHAGRFFRDQRLLVEAIIIWPDRRDCQLERALLEGVQPLEAGSAVRPWRALGISMSIASRFDLRRNVAKVGRVSWHFQAPDGRGPSIMVERLAMPEYWLKGSLEDWLTEQLPPKHRTIASGPVDYAGHRGQQLITSTRAGTLAGLRGIRQLRLDVAWLCPTERRVYHITQTELSREQTVSLPDDLNVWCCRPVPAASSG